MSPVREYNQSRLIIVQNIRELNIKIVDMAHANAEAFFECASQLATAKAPSDIIELWTAYARKQFETLTEQAKELTALGQKVVGQSAENARLTSR